MMVYFTLKECAVTPTELWVFVILALVIGISIGTGIQFFVSNYELRKRKGGK